MLLVTACGSEGESSKGRPQDSSDPGVDGGAQTDGGSSTTAVDARVPPPFDAAVDAAPDIVPDAAPDAPPAKLTPCEEAVFHSDLPWIQANIFSVSCASGSCHDATSPEAQLDLTAGHAHYELVGVKSTIYTSWNLVTPGNADASMLLVRLGGATGPGEATMPKGQASLCSEKIDAVRRWIAAGAPSD